MGPEKLAIALRQGVFSPSEIRQAARIGDQNENIVAIFLPDGRSGYEALEIASQILSETRRVHAGSGVIRLHEHDTTLLARRVQTIQGFDANRLILGVGTGSPGPQPGKSVTTMLELLAELNKRFQSFPEGVEAPEIYVAALKTGIAKRAAAVADGLLFNFCSPRHAARLIEEVKPELTTPIEFACYLKLFYSSRSAETAQRLMVQEFLNYDATPQYHQMFQQDGTANAIAGFRKTGDWRKGPVDVPKELMQVSLANPDKDQLGHYVRAFRSAGVTIPVLYPYFTNDEEPEFKRTTLERMIETMTASAG